MPRPSMVNQRRGEILDAFEDCILDQGIQGTSLETLAERAKMKRSILRHYIGNRDDIICALSERWRAHYDKQWQETLAYLPASNRVGSLLNTLFAERDAEYIKGTLIGEAVFAEAKRLPQVKADIQYSMDRFMEILSDELKAEFPSAQADRINEVAHGIHANYLMSESLLPLGMLEDVKILKRASTLLIETLK